MGWYFKVQRSWSFSNPTAGVVVGPVARAIVTAEVSRVSDGHASQVCAHTYNDQPIGILHANAILFWIAETRNVHLSFRFDFRLCSINFREDIYVKYKCFLMR